MVKVTYSRRADVDLDNLAEWVASRDGELRAFDIIDRIFQRIDNLESHPQMGVARPDIRPSARALVSDRWLILYEIHADTVRIVRVVDGALDLQAITWDYLG